MVASGVIAKPMRAFGGFFSMALDTFAVMFRPPFAWREFISQSWFVARVSIIPTLMLTIPYQGLGNAAIARRLVLTEGGVEKHTQRIFAKLALDPGSSQHRRVSAVLAFLERR